MRKPKGFWLDHDNCIKAVKEIAEKEKWTELPSLRKCIKAGMPENAIRNLGGRNALSKILGLPLAKTHTRIQANVPAMEKWEGKPSKAFEIEKEAREQGLCYADIQKQKTLAMVGGVKI